MKSQSAVALRVRPAVLEETKRRGVEVATLRTEKAIELLRDAGGRTNAVLHITC